MRNHIPNDVTKLHPNQAFGLLSSRYSFNPSLIIPHVSVFKTLLEIQFATVKLLGMDAGRQSYLLRFSAITMSVLF